LYSETRTKSTAFGKVQKEFPNSRVWGFPKNQNGRIGCKAETLIFPVCTDTGCACYSPKSHIQSHLALLFLKKQGRIF